MPSVDSRRSYAAALDSLFLFSAGRPLTRALLMEYRASLNYYTADLLQLPRLLSTKEQIGE